MGKQSIIVNGVAYSHDQVVAGAFVANSNFERSTLSFCQAWFTDKNTFSLMTSGSTGPPKEVTFTRDQMIASAKMTGDALNLKSESTSLVCLDTKYIAGQMMLVRSFVIGMNIIAVEPGANPLNTFSKNQSIDLAAFVPYQVQAILNSAPEKLDNVKTAIIGGAPMDQT
ncbi:MAG: AMP-binding protein, partial [Cyclobacteriaceae bacterium]